MHASLLVFALVCSALWSTTAAAEGSCPLLKDAVHTTPDFNHSDLSISWFTRRGLQRDGRYGCMTAEAGATGYHFALGCSCAAWATCHSRNLEYDKGFDDRYSSRLGECRCCSWWVILFIVLGSLGVIIFATQVPRIKRWILKKWRARKRAKRNDMAALEEGGEDMRDFTGIGAHAALNNSANDRKHSELKVRRKPSGSRRRNPSSNSPPTAVTVTTDSAPPVQKETTMPGFQKEATMAGSPSLPPPARSPQLPAASASFGDRRQAYTTDDGDTAAVPMYTRAQTPNPFDASVSAGMQTPMSAGSPMGGGESMGSRPEALDIDEDVR